MSADLATFLRARLDEDEAAAHGAIWDDGQSATWTARPPQAEYERFTVVDYLDDGVAVITPENADADGVGQHIARHDPARELREVEAKRKLIELADEASGLDDSVDLERRVSPRDPAAEPYLGEIMLRAMAAVYAAHPDYRAEWRP